MGEPELTLRGGDLLARPEALELVAAARRGDAKSLELWTQAPLLARPGLVLSRQQLEEKLYGWKDEISSNAVEVHIHNLRRKLGETAIRTVRGLGYSLGST